MCIHCDSRETEVLLDAGPQPIASRFLRTASEDETRHPLKLALCRRCGTVQLDSPPTPEQLVPRFDWITYREPEAHLDRLAGQLDALPDLDAGSAVVGVTYKDRPLLDRLASLGYRRLRLLDPARDLGIDIANAGIETIEAVLTPSVAASVAERHGSFDLVVARHLLEHAHRPAELLAALGRLASPRGVILIEVPDGARMFDLLDYSAVWEEHLTYFTAHTLRSALSAHGIELLDLAVHSGGHEELLVAIGRPGATAAPTEPPHAGDLRLARRFGPSLQAESDRIRSLLSRHRADGRKVAVLGAGHLSASYINLHGLGDLLAFVVDDDPNKQGLFMPGSRLPIVSSSELVKANIGLCLLGVGPASEAAVIARNREFVAGGGRFASILPASSLAL